MRQLFDRCMADRVIAWVIMLDFAVIIAMGFPSVTGELFDALRLVDAACLSFFIVEAAYKLKRAGWAAYWADGFNRLDLIVVVLAVPVMLTPVFGINLVILRLTRFVQIMRMLRFVPNIEHIWTGAKRALRASVGTCLGLSLYALVLGAVACQLFGTAAPGLFGNPVTAMYTMFQVFTIEGWHEVPQLVIASMGANDTLTIFAVRSFFVLSVLTGGVIGLGLTNAVFVDEMMMDNNEPLERKIDALTDEIAKLRAELKR